MENNEECNDGSCRVERMLNFLKKGREIEESFK